MAVDKFENLYIETTRGPRTALVRNTGSNPVTANINPVIWGDSANYNIYLLSNGSIDYTLSGAPGYTVRAGFGVVGGTSYATSSNWVATSSVSASISQSAYYTGSVDTNTTSLSSSLIGNDSINALFEVELLNTTTNRRRTYLQSPTQIYNQIII